MIDETVTLRPAAEGDLGALDRLFTRSYTRLLKPDYPPSVLVTAVPLIARAQPALVASGQFYVAERAGALVAAGGWSLTAPDGRPGGHGVGHVRHVATDPDAVRQGIGSRLMAHLMLQAKGSGIAELHCQSTRTAVRFYRAMGFVVHSEIAIPLRAGIVFPAVFMTARLQ